MIETDRREDFLLVSNDQPPKTKQSAVAGTMGFQSTCIRVSQGRSKTQPNRLRLPNKRTSKPDSMKT
jgi:hypothetical protein